jgi:hypothetical protein
MTDENDSARPYEVGHGRPPKHTRFVRGTSGNPKGRPKGSKNFATTIQAELKRRVTVTEDGRRKKISKREAVAKQLVNKAAAGDPRAIPVLLNETCQHEAGSTAGPGSGVLCRPEDQLVMANIVKRIREAELAKSETQPEAPAENSDGDTSSPAKGGTS